MAWRRGTISRTSRGTSGRRVPAGRPANRKIAGGVALAVTAGAAFAVATGTGQAAENCQGLDGALRNNLTFIADQRRNPDANSAARIANRQAVIDLIEQRRTAAGCSGQVEVAAVACPMVPWEEAVATELDRAWSVTEAMGGERSGQLPDPAATEVRVQRLDGIVGGIRGIVQGAIQARQGAGNGLAAGAGGDAAGGDAAGGGAANGGGAGIGAASGASNGGGTAGGAAGGGGGAGRAAGIINAVGGLIGQIAGIVQAARAARDAAAAQQAGDQQAVGQQAGGQQAGGQQANGGNGDQQAAAGGDGLGGQQAVGGQQERAGARVAARIEQIRARIQQLWAVVQQIRAARQAARDQAAQGQGQVQGQDRGQGQRGAGAGTLGAAAQEEPAGGVTVHRVADPRVPACVPDGEVAHTTD
ncbi:hypothetical protein [Micromonospora mirobrigensis]|uniref:Uncharacterized protein n=1 Tax=Micromonospora mirobrigensis TaxID=262898 RepID=A0A1C4Z8L0_9ACTN|nr:hypothetical protein [Micromonospora mirobrigensis]SCF29244.1 hypothetical protein GA0070564_105179 [Micromonospora mirobrigensis]